MRIRQKEDEIKSTSDAFGGQQSTSTTACTMSIGSMFQHCKLENVSNLKKQRRAANRE